MDGAVVLSTFFAITGDLIYEKGQRSAVLFRDLGLSSYPLERRKKAFILRIFRSSYECAALRGGREINVPLGESRKIG
jgi:hypothetical protein